MTAEYHRLFRDGQRPLAEETVRKSLVGRVLAAGSTDNITTHSTRNISIILTLDSEVALHKVQVAASHADPRTTEHYWCIEQNWRTKQNLDDNAVDYVKH